MAQERTDEELLAAYQQGDPGSFEDLLRRHRAPLFTFLLRMLGDRESAEDRAQETFLRIVKGAQAWEHRARFQTWLFTIARNLCVDQSRRDRFRRADSLDAQGPGDEPPMVDSVPGREIDPGRGAESALLRPVLQRARSEEHTSELQSQSNIVCRLLLEKKKLCKFAASHTCTVPSTPAEAMRFP